MKISKNGIANTLNSGTAYLYNDHLMYATAGLAIISGATTGLISPPTVLAGLSVISTAKTSFKIAKATTPYLVSAGNATSQAFHKTVVPLFYSFQKKQQKYVDMNEGFEVLNEDGSTQEKYKLN